MYFFTFTFFGIINILTAIINKLVTKTRGNIVNENLLKKYPKIKTARQNEIEPLILIFPYFFDGFFTKLEYEVSINGRIGEKDIKNKIGKKKER